MLDGRKPEKGRDEGGREEARKQGEDLSCVIQYMNQGQLTTCTAREGKRSRGTERGKSGAGGKRREKR